MIFVSPFCAIVPPSFEITVFAVVPSADITVTCVSDSAPEVVSLSALFEHAAQDIASSSTRAAQNIFLSFFISTSPI